MTGDRPSILRIERARPRGIVFSQRTLTNLTVKTWKKVIARMMELAFLGRPLCFITPAETASSWDLDWTEMIRECETCTIGGYPYFCAFDPAVNSTILGAVAESQDLYLCPVWLAPLTQADKDRLFAVVEAMLKAGLFGWPETNEEFLHTDPDCEFVYWLNPSRPEEAIVDELTRLAKDVNWRVDLALS